MTASIGQMIKKIAGLTDTPDVNEWEDAFIKSIVERTNNGDNTKSLGPRQVDVIERIHRKHFA